MIQLTETAVSKVNEILKMQDPKSGRTAHRRCGRRLFRLQLLHGLREPAEYAGQDLQFGDLKVFVDQASMLYLDGAEVDYVETLEGSGFKFNNPHVKSTCGCGSSFSA